MIPPPIYTRWVAVIEYLTLDLYFLLGLSRLSFGGPVLTLPFDLPLYLLFGMVTLFT